MSDHPFSRPDAPRDPQPSPAATVLLYRKGEGGPELLLMRRHGGSAFMAGVSVFPGGRVDPQDGEAPALAALAGPPLDALSEALSSPGEPRLGLAEAGAYAFGALRELFEEAGVLLAQTPRGEPLDLGDPGLRAALAAGRAAVHGGALPLPALLQELGLRLDVGALAYFARWITPSFERRRFDARFFLAALPPGQEAVPDGAETTELRWLSPAAALAAVRARALVLAPPTLRSVEALAAAPSPAAFAAAARAAPICPILPKVAPGPTIVLPWDPDYPRLEGEGLPFPPEHPDAAAPSRVALLDKIWTSVDPGATP